MIDNIVQLIITDISELPYIEKIGGIVTPLHIPVKVEDKVLTKIIPVCYNTSKNSTCNTGDYTDYCPDSSYKSVSFFECDNISEIDSFADYSVYNATLRFICYLNIDKINLSVTPINNIPFEVIGKLQRQMDNTTPFVFCFIEKASIVKNSNIFSKYTFDETEMQYLTYPNDYFAIDLFLRFRMPTACINYTTLNPKVC